MMKTFFLLMLIVSTGAQAQGPKPPEKRVFCPEDMVNVENVVFLSRELVKQPPDVKLPRPTRRASFISPQIADPQLAQFFLNYFEDYYVSKTTKIGRPYLRLETAIEVRNGKLFINIISQPDERTFWSLVANSSSAGREVSLERDGPNFIYQAFTENNLGHLKKEIGVLNWDDKGRTKSISISSRQLKSQNPEDNFEIILRPIEKRRTKSRLSPEMVNNNIEFRKQFAELYRDYDFVPLTDNDTPDNQVTFSTLQTFGELSLELVTKDDGKPLWRTEVSDFPLAGQAPGRNLFKRSNELIDYRTVDTENIYSVHVDDRPSFTPNGPTGRKTMTLKRVSLTLAGQEVTASYNILLIPKGR